MQSAKTWECNKCGACCRLAGFIIKEWDRGDGACKMLNEDNTCSIYETRPHICRVKKNLYTAEQIDAACDVMRENLEERMTICGN